MHAWVENLSCHFSAPGASTSSWDIPSTQHLHTSNAIPKPYPTVSYQIHISTWQEKSNSRVLPLSRELEKCHKIFCHKKKKRCPYHLYSWHHSTYCLLSYLRSLHHLPAYYNLVILKVSGKSTLCGGIWTWQSMSTAALGTNPLSPTPIILQTWGKNDQQDQIMPYICKDQKHL